MTKFKEVQTIEGYETFADLEENFESEILYADMDDETVLAEVEGEDAYLYLFDGWYVALNFEPRF